MYNKESTEKLAEKLMEKLSKQERDRVIFLIQMFGLYKINKYTYAELDNDLLFTGNKVKEIAYQIQEAMYDGKNSVRLDFEVIKKEDEPNVARKIHG